MFDENKDFIEPIVDVPMEEPEEVVEPEEAPTEVEEIPVEEEVVAMIGKVVNCNLLNVRMKPRKASESIAIISAGDEVIIDIDKSTDEWYAVITEYGVKGYCMLNFIELI